MRKLSIRRKLLLAALGLIAVGVPVVVGWGQVQAGVVTLIHPKDGVRRAFEVATIKPSPGTAQGMGIMPAMPHYSATDISVDDLIKYAYGVKSDAQLVGAPGWLKTEHFDIEAKASDADVAAFNELGFEGRMNVLRLLMQSLLEDRFQLKAKVETRDLPVYALVVDKGGIKMKEVTPPPLPPPGRPPPPPPPPGTPPAPGAASNQIRASALAMPQFAEILSRSYEVGNRSVVDETGLKGNYEFVLRGTSLRPPPPNDANGSPQESVTSIFTALPEQLGLKLVPVKAPVEVLVIDHIEQPSPN
jgi:bla regulator protein blaR1